MRDAGSYGTRTGEVGLDWAAVVRRQHEIVARLRPDPAAFERSGVRVHLGEAALLDPRTVRVDGRELRGERIVIAAGSVPVIPSVPGREAGITSDDLLFLPRFPERLVLVGAGAVGLEMAGAFADLGARVEILAREDEILPAFDVPVARALRAMLEARGIVVHRGATLTALAGQPGDVAVRFTAGGVERETRATAVCFATGRRFEPRLIGAEGLGLATAPRGLGTTPHLRTSVEGVYAAGDAAGHGQLTTTAAVEGRVAATNALRGDALTADLTLVPQVIFTTPEIARVGFGHREARARGIACHTTSHDLRGASNGVATGEDGGHLELVFDGETERLLGAQIVSWAAAEIIQLAAVAIRAGLTAPQLAAQVSVHPSQSERLFKVAAHDYHEICEA